MKYLVKKTVISAAAAAAIYLVLFFFLDRTIDLWVYSTFSNTWVFRLGTAISYSATGAFIKLAIALCLLLIVVVDPGIKKRWTRNLVYLCVSCAVAVVIGDGLKYLIGRHRPVMLFEQGRYGLSWFSSQWSSNSSPSGHTLRAFSILTALSLLFRRLAAVFIFLAVLVGASRVFVTAHYPSDVVFGAFIGIFTAIWTYQYFFNAE